MENVKAFVENIEEKEKESAMIEEQIAEKAELSKQNSSVLNEPINTISAQSEIHQVENSDMISKVCQTDVPEVVEIRIDTLEGIQAYISIGMSSMLLNCLEWWVFELIILICGYIGVQEQAAQIVLDSCFGILFVLVMGF